MSESLLRELAQSIAREQFLLQWPVYALMFLLALAASAIAAFLGAYWKTRGKNLATKADLDAVLNEVKERTKVVEKTRSEISQADWAARELKKLRRKRLEALVHAVHEAQAWQDQLSDRTLFGSEHQPGPSPLPKVDVIAGLYFPELRTEVYEYGQAFRDGTIHILATGQKLLEVKQDNASRQAIFDEHSKMWPNVYRDQLRKIAAVETKARSLLDDIIGT